MADAEEIITGRLTGEQTNGSSMNTPRLVSIDETLRRASGDRRSISDSDISSSPPGHSMAMATAGIRRVPPSPTLPPMPETPTPARPARGARTEPRQPRHQLDGTSFSVYNDTIPTEAQPQTPADLSRHYRLTEQDAAYTAPPGVLHTGSPTRRPRFTTADLEVGPGEQTPMARAMGSRERRARELMRSVRAEGVRLQRLREQDRQLIARGLDGNEEMRDRGGPGPVVAPELWRDDFEGDRVGDENWEGNGEWSARGRDGMRVVSGNARDRLWEER